MFLFDAVNMTWFDGSLAVSDIDRLPTNIVRCVHAMRDPNAGSRTSWGNCGTTPSIPNQLIQFKFWGSHAALGGTPGTGDLEYYRLRDPVRLGLSPPTRADADLWEPTPALADDFRCAMVVKAWMWQYLSKSGVI